MPLYTKGSGKYSSCSPLSEERCRQQDCKFLAFASYQMSRRSDIACSQVAGRLFYFVNTKCHRIPFENVPHARILGNFYHPSFGGCAKATGMIQSFLIANSFEIDEIGRASCRERV